jgi:hypothetical protein
MDGNGDHGGAEPHQPAEAGGQPPEAAPPPAPHPVAIRAHTFVQRWGSASDPAALMCDDGNVYVVKAGHNGRPDISRMMIADHVVGRVGQLLEAPVPPVAFIDVPAELVAAQQELANFVPGIAHGSRYIPNTTEREGLSHVAEPANRPRFARLAVLFGWAHGADHQFIYVKGMPPLVYSHDHGHFFPGAPNWTAASFAQHNATLDANIANGCNLTPAEIADAIARLNAVAPANLNEVVDGVPAAWAITPDERAAMVAFLTMRRAALIAQHPPGQH